jgi:hypothetical protein
MQHPKIKKMDAPDKQLIVIHEKDKNQVQP